MKKLLIVPALLLILFVVIAVRFTIDKRIDYVVSTEDITVPTFKEVSLDFTQFTDDSKSLPFVASAIIDIENDGLEEVFIGGGVGQDDAFFEFKNDGFKRLTKLEYSKSAINETTFSAAVLDVDNNGYSDLIVTRTNGVWLYLNNNGKFNGKKLQLDLGSDTTPMGVAVADINKDGNFDLFISGYIRKELVEGQNIFNKKNYGGTSRLFLNKGDNTFLDITEKSGLLKIHNTFMGIFVDIDADGLIDLVVAEDTGHVQTWKNIGNNQFINKANPNSNEFSYPMGIAVTDFHNDESVDFFFSNVGSTPPEFLVKGDLTDNQIHNFKWIMFENQGGFEFKDVAQAVKLADYEFSWGAIFEDFNLDGLDDLVVSENYIGFPAHKFEVLRLPGRFLLQTDGGEFSETGLESGVINTGYGISPLTADFNNDGYPDLIHINIAGKPKAFINNGGNSNFVKIILPSTVESIGAKIVVKRSDGKQVVRYYVSGEGLGSDQSHIQIIGLDSASATSVSVKFISGDYIEKQGPFVNQNIIFNSIYKKK